MERPPSTRLASGINDVADDEPPAHVRVVSARLWDLPAEMDATRRCLWQLPGGAASFRPGEAVRTLGQLVRHSGEVLALAYVVLRQRAIEIDRPLPDWARGATDLPAVAAAAIALCDVVEETAASMTDEALDRPWRVLHAGRERAAYARYDAFRHLGLSHLAHHRGQIVLYRRLLGVPVPDLYADALGPGSAVG